MGKCFLLQVRSRFSLSLYLARHVAIPHDDDDDDSSPGATGAIEARGIVFNPLQ